MSQPIVEFYLGRRADSAGRYLHEIQDWGHDRLEYVHDFIQWLFPLRERSPVNPDAPVLDEGQIAQFRSQSPLRASLLKSFDVMLDFYGFERKDKLIARCRLWESRRKNWLSQGNHNYRRITRILKCMSILGLEEYAIGFLGALREVYDEHSMRIGAHTFGFWKEAVDKP